MGVFDSMPPPGPRRVGPASRPWLSPPADVHGSFVPGRVVFVRTESFLVVAQRFVAYPTGVDFSIEIRSNDRVPRSFAVPGPRHSAGPPWLEDRLAVGVVHADGSRASSLTKATLEEPSPPVVQTYEGGGSGGTWAQRCWTWPLPPPGILRIVVGWPSAGLTETWGEIDATTLRTEGVRAPFLAGYLR